MKKFLLSILTVSVTAGVLCAEKKMLDHTSFDAWKSVQTNAITKNGDWSAYQVNPQEGDGVLYVRNNKNGKSIEVARGYQPTFTADGKWAIALIRAPYADTRKAKIAKKKDLELPQDSLAIIDLMKQKVEKIAGVTGYKVGLKGGDWVAYSTCDTLYSSTKNLKNKDYKLPVMVRNLNSGVSKLVKYVGAYGFDRTGDKVAFILNEFKKDSLSFNGVAMMSLPDTTIHYLDKEKKFYGDYAFDENGKQFAIVASDDSIKTGTRKAFILYSNLDKGLSQAPMKIESSYKSETMGEMLPNQYTKVIFSKNGKRLIGGVAPVIAPDDTTIVDFENPALDIWRWDAPMTPPQELKDVKNLKEKNFPVCINLNTFKQVYLVDQPLAKVIAPNKWDGNWALISDPTEDAVEKQWNYFAPVKLSVMNVNTGEKKVIKKVPSEEVALSPGGKYVYWFEDRNFYTYDVESGEIVNITENMPVHIWNDDDDHPMPSEPWDYPLWSAGDKRILIYDKYDLWSVDPTGKVNPVCLTNQEGRKRNMRFRVLKTNSEWRYATEGETLLFNVFDYTDKYNGLATLVYGKAASPKVAVLNGYSYTQVKKAENANVYMWQRANFSTSPDVWSCVGNDFMKAVQVSDANPQMKDYRWGTAQLVKWNAYDGTESEGVLYVPDDLDPNKKYPMLCVFYETGSEELYRHYTMEPSWSWVNYPFYVSRGYVIFVPDIHYTAGVPGESCYNYVCSGAEEMCKRYPWIDKDRIGIDGQSWGGYQTAYLVTRTNMFACAGSGAPVSNMTSAFGGIRWESGDSRQGQYEMGQSRIGKNLWEGTELYIANSPVFHANRVETPLLIMHNDNDGAVPWYQGIELFMALRRLQKPVWMLQYNGEAHNIRARKNRKDITVRLQQFFDHYLKGDPMPKWMKEGIPAVRKGQELGY